MPSALTYPGVYVEEIPSGVRTIVGVATSITAFVGRASRGPVNEPTSVFGFADFERQFGGLAADSTMSYAVRDFYLNRGSQALIIRVTRTEDDLAAPATIALPAEPAAPPADDAGALKLEAASPGAWGNNLRASVDHTTADPNDKSLFNLTIVQFDPSAPGEAADKPGLASERFLNLSIKADSARYAPRVLAEGSTFVRVAKDDKGEWVVPKTRPSKTQVPVEPIGDGDGGGGDGGDGAGGGGDGNGNGNGAAAGDVAMKDKPVVAAADGKDGGDLQDDDLVGNEAAKTGFYALEKADLFNLLCLPPPVRDEFTSDAVYKPALTYCKKRRAMLLVDPGSDWTVTNAASKADGLGLTGLDARNAAVYFPRLLVADPLRDNQTVSVVPCGAIAGVMARTDTERGVWKAPAGLDASINGVRGLAVNMTDDENGTLNPLGVNCLRTFRLFGSVVWGARTMRGADQMTDEYKYVPVRRLALFLEETLYRNTKWVVFEPNDEPLWAQIRLNIGAFMQDLFRQGAFQGDSPAKAYFVKCDKETTTQSDINRGIVNIVVGFAPLKPAEFVVIKIQQIVGELQT